MARLISRSSFSIAECMLPLNLASFIRVPLHWFNLPRVPTKSSLALKTPALSSRHFDVHTGTADMLLPGCESESGKSSVPDQGTRIRRIRDCSSRLVISYRVFESLGGAMLLRNGRAPGKAGLERPARGKRPTQHLRS